MADAIVDFPKEYYLEITWRKHDWTHDGYCSDPGESRARESPVIETEYNKIDIQDFLTWCGKYVRRDLTVDYIMPATSKNIEYDEASKRYGKFFMQHKPDEKYFCCGEGREFVSAKLGRDMRNELYQHIFKMPYVSFHKEGVCSAMQEKIKEKEAHDLTVETAEIEARKKSNNVSWKARKNCPYMTKFGYCRHIENGKCLYKH